MSVKVKWKGTTSNPISLTQCIRQGAKLSTTLYKRYINTILDSIARSHMGATIGTLLVSSPTCADDIALIANTRAELQDMLDLVQYNTNRDLVKINATKSEIVTSAKTKDKDSFIFNGQNIEQTSSTKHLGITRTKFCKVNIEDRLQSGRRTIYAMLGPGLKSMVGLVALKIRKTYALPRCIYGMETQTYSKSDMERDWSAIKGKYVGSCINYLNDVHLQQYLYALLGVEPIETAIDRNMLYSSWALPDNQTLLNSRFYSVSYIWLIHMTRTLFVVSEKI
jgi:GR25 family glycosyltransferase involved in LPS biosynthesis